MLTETIYSTLNRSISTSTTTFGRKPRWHLLHLVTLASIGGLMFLLGFAVSSHRFPRSHSTVPVAMRISGATQNRPIEQPTSEAELIAQDQKRKIIIGLKKMQYLLLKTGAILKKIVIRSLGASRSTNYTPTIIPTTPSTSLLSSSLKDPSAAARKAKIRIYAVESINAGSLEVHLIPSLENSSTAQKLCRTRHMPQLTLAPVGELFSEITAFANSLEKQMIKDGVKRETRFIVGNDTQYRRFHQNFLNYWNLRGLNVRLLLSRNTIKELNQMKARFPNHRAHSCLILRGGKFHQTSLECRESHQVLCVYQKIRPKHPAPVNEHASSKTGRGKTARRSYKL